MKLSHEIFAFDVVKDRNNPRRKKTSLIKLATMIEVSAKDHRFCNHLNTSLPSRDSWPPRHEFIILYFAFLVMRESIRSYLHSTKTSTITSSSSTLCNDQSRFIQRRVMVGDDSLMSTRRPSLQPVPRTNTKISTNLYLIWMQQSRENQCVLRQATSDADIPSNPSLARLWRQAPSISSKESQISGQGEQKEARSLQCPTRSNREASISATPCRVVHAGAETSTEDKLGFRFGSVPSSWLVRTPLRELHGLLEQQDEPVLCLCLARAASESSRSSYYSLHMEGSGKLELRWESNITFWKSLRLYRGKARVFSSSSRALFHNYTIFSTKETTSASPREETERERVERSYRNIRST
ncbi:hypothetical protein Bca52824_087661 [Brassica carinata]|uniref:Uncharacterized protein n=1 Tax=Brassica carinata TaxID=52824 RepID=A0A8X7PCQ7_BRACI|nr:hypothetical protein Bca52824_087661 [Brassica carinata]